MFVFVASSVIKKNKSYMNIYFALIHLSHFFGSPQLHAIQSSYAQERITKRVFGVTLVVLLTSTVLDTLVDVSLKPLGHVQGFYARLLCYENANILLQKHKNTKVA